MQNIILNTGTAKADEVRANRGFWECSEKVRQKVLMPELKASIFSHVSQFHFFMVGNTSDTQPAQVK